MTDICHKCKRPIGDAMSISYVGAGVGHFYSADCYRALDAEISRLTAELAAARKPQELPKPTDDDIFEAWCDDANAALVRKEDAGEPNIAAAGFRAGFMAGHGFALESLAAAQDGGERKASTCSRWVHGDCMCVKPPGHDGRCDCACYVTEDPS